MIEVSFSILICFIIFQTLACTICPAGFYCGANALPVPCATGTYSTVGQVTCTDCPTGQSCHDPAAAPVNCVAGYYSPVVCID